MIIMICRRSRCLVSRCAPESHGSRLSPIGDRDFTRGFIVQSSEQPQVQPICAGLAAARSNKLFCYHVSPQVPTTTLTRTTSKCTKFPPGNKNTNKLPPSSPLAAETTATVVANGSSTGSTRSQHSKSMMRVSSFGVCRQWLSSRGGDAYFALAQTAHDTCLERINAPADFCKQSLVRNQLGKLFYSSNSSHCHHIEQHPSLIGANKSRYTARFLSDRTPRVKSDKGERMSAEIISGKEVADEIRANLREKVKQLPDNLKPKLVIVQVGGREDSNVYIRMKIQFAESIGASAELVKLERDVSEQELESTIKRLNEDKSVHGIITQLPFDCTNKIDSNRMVNLIDPKKDVDGLSIYNAGKLLHGELDSSAFIPCTPNGCMELIKKSGIKLEGTHSVVIGRSKIVGSPMAQLLIWNNSTVTICHSRTKNLDEICRRADIVVAAVGRAQMVKKSWLKPGAVVIDCGINVIPDATKKSGTRLVGDVDFEECKEVASAITPVPGGVGPMTVAMLIANTVESATRCM